MFQEDLRSIVQNVTQALLEKNVDALLSYCTKDVIVSWAHFVFKGRNEVRRWAEELWQMFPKIGIREKRLLVGKNVARHVFVFIVISYAHQKDMLPVIATYRLRDEKTVHLNTISVGLLSFTDEDLGS